MYKKLNSRVMKPSKVILLALVAGLIWSCDTKEKQMLISKLDSLQIELEASHETALALQEIGVLLDTIDASRKVLRTNVVEGTTYSDYKNRLTELNNYVVETQNKITELENSLQKSNRNYAGTIKRLKADLESSKLQLAALQTEVDRMRGENEMLVQTVSQRDEKITEQQGIIQVKEENISSLEAKVEEINKMSTDSKAELYFAQAKALEEAAERTKFAPKKKKETQREALELYKLSLSYGNQEAQQRITELEKELG
jgi:chromosome segregation ATPase